MQILMRSFFIWLILLSSLWACDENLKALDLNKQKWLALDWKDYSYTYQQKCFCPIDYGRAIRIEVENNQVVSAHFIDTKKTVSEQIFKDIETIDDLFALLSKSLDNNVEKLIVSYHEDNGFPESIDIDARLRRADDERKIQISDLIKK